MVDLQTEPALNDLVKAAKECLERMAPSGGKKTTDTHKKLFFFLRFVRKCLKKVVTGLLKQPLLLDTHHPKNATPPLFSFTVALLLYWLMTTKRI